MADPRAPRDPLAEERRGSVAGGLAGLAILTIALFGGKLLGFTDVATAFGRGLAPVKAFPALVGAAFGAALFFRNWRAVAGLIGLGQGR